MIEGNVSHYRIVRPLGAGGMGEVYLAEDTRLGRQVALKFLPASYQYDPDRRARFLKEARAASALRSPNIAAIYDIGVHEGSSFIAMEYVEGETISRRLERGPIAVKDVMDIARQVADALDEAHELGIIHRDIKSSNLMVTERGLVKVLDFGLAKMVEREGGGGDESQPTVMLGQQTSLGVVVGTVWYMSPEQALGKDVDTRSDIFSLGVVIYEMLTGRLPFEGETSSAVVDLIVHQEPPALARFNYNVPAELERITRKCMEKDRERRYQSTRELVTDLRNLQRDADSGALTSSQIQRRTEAGRGARSRKAIDSLAILPFANASNDPDTDYLSDGITESIINNLSQVPKLRVMARSTVFRYKGRESDPREVGRDLDVRAVLTGRLLQRGEHLVIKAELVDAVDGSQLWGEQYNRRMADIFSIEEEISKEISEKLRLKLSGAQKKRLTKRHTENTEAYQLYLKGRYHWNKRIEEELKKGIQYFEQAIAVDPGYALAYAGLADSYNILVSYSAMAPKDAFPKAKQAAERALQLDDRLGEAHASLAFVRFGFDWDFAEAEREFARSIELNPGYAAAHQWNAIYLAAMERLEEAKAETTRAQDLDPLSLPIMTNVGWIHHLSRRYDRAIDAYKKALEMDQNFILARRRLGQTYEQKGMYDEAIAEFQKTLAIFGGDTESIAALGHAYAASGREAEAYDVIDKLAELGTQRYIPSYFTARIHTALGHTDQAFEWLEKAYEERYGFLIYMKVEPSFDPIRQDPRFSELARRVGLE
ncbi:MAG TPA: protein kinase [Blastocatellia bacterium]|nr:protein kinase [Blastocatellia bacterium]